MLHRYERTDCIIINVKEESFRKIVSNLQFQNFPKLQQIHIQSNAFEDVEALTISNLPSLQIISLKDSSFFFTRECTISSSLCSINM